MSWTETDETWAGGWWTQTEVRLHGVLVGRLWKQGLNRWGCTLASDPEHIYSLTSREAAVALVQMAALGSGW